jgi:hypothetical protein
MRLADSYIELRRFDDAIAVLEALVRLSNQNAVDVMLLERTKRLAGRPNDFEGRLAAILAGRATTYASPGMLANAFFAVGRDDEGFAWLERAYEERANNIVYLPVEPHYKRVRPDPRFQQILRKINLP